MKLFFLLSLIFLGTCLAIALVAKELWKKWRVKQSHAKARSKAAALVEEAVAAEGGRPDNPIIISTPSVVETRASRTLCPVCEVEMHVEAHRAVEYGDRRLRVAVLKCRRCEFQRDLYFALRPIN